MLERNIRREAHSKEQWDNLWKALESEQIPLGAGFRRSTFFEAHEEYSLQRQTSEAFWRRLRGPVRPQIHSLFAGCYGIARNRSGCTSRVSSSRTPVAGNSRSGM